MSRAWRQFRTSLLCLAVLAGGAVAAAAAAAGPAVGGSLLAEVAPGGGLRILHAAGPDRPWRPASLTKLMTLYLVFEALGERRLGIDDPLPVSPHAAGQPPTRLGLSRGDRITVGTAIRAVTVTSANDAAVVLAEAVAGREPAFVERMNATARRLGLGRTRFRNATGLPGPGQQTTARDMARLALALRRDFPEHYHYFSVRAVRHGGVVRYTHNRLLQVRSGIDGLKTGFTCEAGFNVVAAERRDDRRLVAVVLGAPSRRARDRLAGGLLDGGFSGDLARAPATLRPLAPLPVCPPAPARLLTRVAALPGWAVFLGNYTERAEAERRVAAARAILTSLVPAGDQAPGGRPRGAVIARPGQGRPTWKALVAGLTAAGAGQGCRALWDRGWTCEAHSPARIAMAGYARQ